MEVTVLDLCEHCKELKPEVKPREKYTYSQYKWVRMNSCQQCFDKAVEEANKAKPTGSSTYTGWGVID